MTAQKVEALTERQAEIAGDLGTHATKQCIETVGRAMELADHPGQAQMIAVIVACGMIGCAMGAVIAQYPDLRRISARDIVLTAITEMMDDEAMAQPS